MSEHDYASIKKTALAAIAAAGSVEEIRSIEQQFLGRTGLITGALRGLKDVANGAERRRLGAVLNNLKVEITAAIEVKNAALADAANAFRAKTEVIDVTAPGLEFRLGHRHPLRVVTEDMVSIFQNLGFSVVDGPEVENDYYNFTALNIPPRHPARDLWSTFWLAAAKDLLLRTHTSPMQVRYMEQHTPPLRIVVPGKCYRYEATDRTHEAEFRQLEGLLVDHKVSIANFRAVIEVFFKRLFGNKPIGVRLRPSYFPFVEPGFEVDMSCLFCDKKGCQVCQQAGWLEMAGAGLVHPNVFKAAGFTPGEWQGFAFGLGIERVAMLKYNIPDIRIFNSGDVHLTRQF